MTQVTTAISLDWLPPEPLNMIVKAIDKCDLPALRLTCKTMNTVVFPTFGKACFEVCEHILSLHSLHRLVEITAHASLGAFVRTVSLDTYRFTEEGLDDLEHNLRVVKKKYPTKNMGKRYEMQKDALEFSRRDQITTYKRNLREQQLLGEGEGSRLLGKAFGNLKHTGHALTIDSQRLQS